VQSVGTAVVLESSCGFHDVIVCLYECMRGYFSKKKHGYVFFADKRGALLLRGGYTAVLLQDLKNSIRSRA
jgi:hypothetical protein